MGMVFAPSVLVIVFQINVADFAFRSVDAERQTAIASNAKAPGALAVTG